MAQFSCRLWLSFRCRLTSACSHHLDDQFFGASSSRAEGQSGLLRDGGRAAGRYWGTLLTPLIRPDLAVLPYPMPITYGEFLICLNPWRDHGEIERLLAGLHRTLMLMRQDRPGLEQLTPA